MRTKKYSDKIPVLFENVQDFPIEGFEFPDITPILENNVEVFRDIITDLSFPYIEVKPDCIVCVESFGYVFGVPIAHILGCKIVLARKAGKLPRKTISQNYEMCYSSSKSLEINATAIKPNDTVVIIDDFLASGGTLLATIKLIKEVGGIVQGAGFVSELVDMNARQSAEFQEVKIHSIFKMRFDEKKHCWVSSHNAQ